MHVSILSGVPAVVLCFAACTAATGGATEPDPLEALNRALAETRSYTATLEFTTDAMQMMGMPPSDPTMHLTVRTELAAVLPDRLKMDTVISPNSPEAIRILLVFDGAVLWVTEAALGSPAPDVNSIRIDATKVRISGRPFDAGYALKGNGLLPGYDLVGTLRRMVAMYPLTDTQRVERVNGERCRVLSGRRSLESGLGHLMADNPHALAGLVRMKARGAKGLDDAARARTSDALIRQLTNMLHFTRELTVWVSEKDGFARQWSWGDGTAQAMRATVSAWAPNASVPDDIFAIGDMRRDRAKDVTDDVLASREALLGSPHDVTVLEAAREDVLRVIRTEDRLPRRAPPVNAPSLPEGPHPIENQ